MNVTDAHSLFRHFHGFIKGRGEYAYEEGSGKRTGPFVYDGELVIWLDHNPPTVAQLRDWLAAQGATLLHVQTSLFDLCESHPSESIDVDGRDPLGCCTWSIQYRVPFNPTLAAKVTKEPTHG